MVHADRQVTPVVVPSELRSCHLPLLESAGLGDGFLEVCFFLKSAGSAAADSALLAVLGERARERLLVQRFVGGLLEFFLGDVLLGEVPEGRVRVFGGVWVFPGFVGFVVLLAQDVFELVLA